jgi:hypothetical protein
MICENCNKEIEQDSKFCSFCGYKIENIEDKKEDTANLKESISNNLETKLNNTDENKNPKKSILKEVIYRIIGVVIAYLGFVAVKVWLVTKGISFGEFTLLGLFVFLAIYKIIVGYTLNIKSSKSMGILFTTISIILVFISV